MTGNFILKDNYLRLKRDSDCVDLRTKLSIEYIASYTQNSNIDDLV